MILFRNPARKARRLEKAREQFPKDDPLHYLHVPPLTRKTSDPKMVQDRTRTHDEIRADPGEVVTDDMSHIDDEG